MRIPRLNHTWLFYGLCALAVTTCSWKAAALKIPAQVRYAASSRDALPTLACAFVVIGGDGPSSDFFPANADSSPNCVPSGIASTLVSLDELQKGVLLQVIAGPNQPIYILGVTTQGGCDGVSTPQELFLADKPPIVVEIGATVADLLVGAEVDVPDTYFTDAGNLAACGADKPGVIEPFALDSSSPVCRPFGTVTFTASGGTPPYTLSLSAGAGSFVPETGIYTATVALETVSVTATDSAGDSMVKTVTVVVGGATLAGFPNPLDVFVGGYSSQAKAFVVQTDGKPLLAGQYQDGSGNPPRIAVARMNTNGTTDMSFNSSGNVKHSATAFLPHDVRALAVREEAGGKKIYVGGKGTTGMGEEKVFVLKLNDNGSVDSSFGNGAGTDPGFFIHDFALGNESLGGIGFQSDGSLILGLSRTVLNVGIAKLKSDGSGLDTSFAVSGERFVTVPSPFTAAQIDTMAIAPDDKILLGGRFTYSVGYFGFAQFNSVGDIDLSFDADGFNGFVWAGDAYATAIALQPMGDVTRAIVVGASLQSFYDSAILALARSNGLLDPLFAPSEVPPGKKLHDRLLENDYAGGVAIQSHDNKIVVVGHGYDGISSSNPTHYLARYAADGSIPDTDFGTGGVVKYIHGSAVRTVGVGLTPDGKIFAGGDIEPAAGQPNFIFTGNWQ